jgi:hypothetical protein
VLPRGLERRVGLRFPACPTDRCVPPSSLAAALLLSHSVLVHSGSAVLAANTRTRFGLSVLRRRDVGRAHGTARDHVGLVAALRLGHVRTARLVVAGRHGGSASWPRPCAASPGPRQPGSRRARGKGCRTAGRGDHGRRREARWAGDICCARELSARCAPRGGAGRGGAGRGGAGRGGTHPSSAWCLRCARCCGPSRALRTRSSPSTPSAERARTAASPRYCFSMYARASAFCSQL